MTENELDQQARLWHVESTLKPHKAAPLEARLQAALPAARTRRCWQVTGAVVALASLPLGRVAVTVLSDYRLAKSIKIEPLEIFPGERIVNTLSLGPDGTVAGATQEIQGIRKAKHSTLWKPGQSRPKRIGLAVVRGILSNGTVVGSVFDKKSGYSSALWEGDNIRLLQPLAGYVSTSADFVLSDGIIGHSRMAQLPGKSPKEVGTLWHGSKLEPLERDFVFSPQDSPHPIDANAQSEFLITSNPYKTKHYCIYSGNKRIPVLREERDQNKNLMWEADPKFLGKNGMIFGIMSRGGVTQVAFWTSPSASPRPLWEKSFSFGPMPTACTDADDEGKVVGVMTNPITETTSLFLWKAGRYFDLQRLLPPISGWHLTSVLRVEGRFILGQGTYQRRPSHYRLTLPPGFP
ncbi:hypothetical protein [Armatimonas sp.]|uniref:hypothetical protein n=1 Tax=Armatimonas sp. TaxID=1872638 RepID=UPI00375390F4